MSVIGASVGIDTGAGLSASVNWSKRDHDAVFNLDNSRSWTSDVSVTHVGIGVGYALDAITLGANWGSKSTEGTFQRTNTNAFTGEDKATGFGFSAVYDIGGGAALQLGVGNGTTDKTRRDGAYKAAEDGDPDTMSKDYNTWSLGLAFSF